MRSHRSWPAARGLSIAARMAIVAAPIQCCVAAGTRVRTPAGDRAIEALAVGDDVVVVDPRSGESQVARIVATRSAVRECLEIVHAYGRLVCTPDHPLHSPETGRFEPASAWADARLTRLSLLHAGRVVDSEVLTTRRDVGLRTVFDLEVDHPLHDFVADGVIVHNKSFRYPTVVFICDPSQPDPCPETHACCSDDPASVDDDEPFAGHNNERSATGMCVNGSEIPAGFGHEERRGCPVPCNPTLSDQPRCSGERQCCQTVEITEADCVFDESLDAHRPADGREAEAAALAEAPGWGVDDGTHQDPDFTGCEAFAGGDRQSEDFFACVRTLTVANQRGYCMRLGDGQTCPIDRPDYIDACEHLDEGR